MLSEVSQAGHVPTAEFVDWTRDIVDPGDTRAPVTHT
jgi:3-mercaptopyruvate sulfurtransferase SseA